MAQETRRRGYAALDDALKRAGIPRDLIALPVPDDTRKLLVVNDHCVRWIYDISKMGARAEIHFNEGGRTGVVLVQDVFRLLENSRTFEPEMYGFTRDSNNNYSGELRFDITESYDQAAMEDLPFRPPKRTAVRSFTCKGSL